MNLPKQTNSLLAGISAAQSGERPLHERLCRRDDTSPKRTLAFRLGLVDLALKNGEITKESADAMKAEIRSEAKSG